MRKFIIVLVTIVLAASLAIVGCAEPAPPPEAPTPAASTPEAPTPAPTPAPTASDRPPAGHPGNPYEGLAVKPDGTPYKFVMSPCILAAPWLAFSANIGKSYIERAGGELAVLDPEMSLEKQIADMDDIIARGGIDGVFLNPIDPPACVSAIERLKEAGIACVCWGDEDPSRTVTSSIHDYVKLGEIAGEYFAKVAEERNEKLIVYEIMGNIDHLSAQQRHQGLHNILDPNSLVEVHTSPACNWVGTMAAEAVVDTFGAHPEWNAIYDMGNMAEGAISGLATLGRLYPVGHPEHVVLVATDGSPAAMEAAHNKYTDVVIGHSPWDELDIGIKAMFTEVILGKPIKKLYNGRNYYIRGDWIDYQYIWGNVTNAGTPYDELPVLDQSDAIATPYKGMP